MAQRSLVRVLSSLGQAVDKRQPTRLELLGSVVTLLCDGTGFGCDASRAFFGAECFGGRSGGICGFRQAVGRPVMTELRQTKSELTAAQTELAAQRVEVSELKASVNLRFQGDTGNSTAAAENVRDQLQQQLDAENSALEYLNQRVRSNNIVMLGVSDTAAYSRPTDLELLVKKELDSATPSRSAEPLSEFITAIKRIGKPRSGANTGNRAMVVEFTSSKAKHQAFQRSAQLRSRGILLSDELTHKQLRAQRQLEADAASLKAKGYQPFYRRNQLKYMNQGRLRTCARGEATCVAPCPLGVGQPRSSGPPGAQGATGVTHGRRGQEGFSPPKQHYCQCTQT